MSGQQSTMENGLIAGFDPKLPVSLENSPIPPFFYGTQLMKDLLAPNSPNTSPETRAEWIAQVGEIKDIAVNVKSKLADSNDVKAANELTAEIVGNGPVEERLNRLDHISSRLKRVTISFLPMGELFQELYYAAGDEFKEACRQAGEPGWLPDPPADMYTALNTKVSNLVSRYQNGVPLELEMYHLARMYIEKFDHCQPKFEESS